MTTKTNQLREKPQFDERANEDSYFAVKEHELIENMKTAHQKVEAERRETLMATCPKCSGQFVKYTVKGLVVERCESCEGIWLNKGDLAEILRRQAMGPLGTFFERYFAKVEDSKKA